MANTACFAQNDIYQSNAYSVEEMCAQEAKQYSDKDYSGTYETCIDQNQERPLYQTDRINLDPPQPDLNTELTSEHDG